jgi:hypothetical protein
MARGWFAMRKKGQQVRIPLDIESAEYLDEI